jgi:hypothetical protein
VGASLNDPVAIQHDYSSVADKIYPDMPRTDLTLTSYPRVGIELTSARTEPLGLGGITHMSDIIVTIYGWMPSNKDSAIAGGLGGTKDLNDLMTNIRGVIRTNAKSFYTFSFMTPIGSTAIIKGNYDKIIQMSQDFLIKFLIE